MIWFGQEQVEFRDATDAVTQRNYPQGQYVGITAYFYTRDHLGSIRKMFTGGGTVVARYDYDPYGRSTTVLGTTPTDFNFTGVYRHSKSNLDLAVFRAYDPDLGRWLSRDPIAEHGGLNLYAYVENNSANATDPSGLMSSQMYATARKAAEEGAKADVLAASGGVVAKYVRGGVEWGGRICKSKHPPDCSKPFYYTRPTQQSVGASHPDTFKNCSGDDEQIGNHYAHPDGTDIPRFDQQQVWRHFGGKPLMLGIPTGPVAYPHAKAIPYGRW